VRPSEQPGDEQEARRELTQQIAQVARREQQAGRSLAGPQRDSISLLLDGTDAADGASSGQVRSLLLALALAGLRVYREETGRSSVALLDDLDSELDEERAGELCATVVRGGQALVTSAHARWAESLRALGNLYEVSGGRVRSA
jgi:DNA replication and repair protein RecF